MHEHEHVAEHRGVLILVLGILGLAVCCLAGIIAWVLANQDLAKMAQGQMDPEGAGMTKAGKICGIVSVALTVLSILIFVDTEPEQLTHVERNQGAWDVDTP